MKRLISILLLIVMLCTPVTAYAADDSIRHEVYGDVSEFEVSTEQSVAKPNADNTQATMGTEVWLFVDPDTASYITFYVTDEEGNPLEDALIYISYNGKSELYGSTDKDGKFKTYLFRDVEYGYTVTKYGYEDASGTFVAPEETKTVRVVLRRYYSLEILVVDGDEPVRNTEVYIDGEKYITDDEGKVKTSRTNGVYDIVVHTEDGRQIPVRVEVDGETKLIIDIGLDDSIVPGGRCTDSFLVYNKDYDPEDYVLTEYKFNADDVEEKQQEDYLSEVSNTILIEAQPERRQNTDGTDTDILKDGEPLYAQRSLMPSGWLLKNWEQQEYDSIVFTDEDMGIRFSIEDLHNEEMMKLYAAMWYLSEYSVTYNDIATEKVQKMWNGYQRSGLAKLAKTTLDPKTIAFDAIRDDFRFDFTLTDEEREKEEYSLLPEGYFTNALFEFMVTPIQRQAMEEMIFDGLRDQESLDKDEIMLASWGYFQEELRRHLTEGKLSERECDELYQFFVDGRLTADEIKELKNQNNKGELSREAVELMLDAAANEKLYRVNCYLHYSDMDVNITSLMNSMELIRKADEEFELEYELQYNKKLEELKKAGKDEKIDEKQLTVEVEKIIEKRYDFMLIDNDSERYTYYDYKPGELTSFEEPELICSLDENGSFFNVISTKNFRQLTVDVRKEAMKDTNRFSAYVTEGTAKLEQHRAWRTEHNVPMLAGLEINE